MAENFTIKDGRLTEYEGDGGVVQIPDGVKVIEEGAFKDNKGITDVVMPDSVEELNDNAFYGCTELKTVVVSKSLKRIGRYAFGACKGIKELEFPDTLEYVGTGAFSGCTKLKKLMCQSNVLIPDESPFDGAKYLHDKNGFLIFAGVAYSYNGKETKVVIPDNVRYIATSFMRLCPVRQKITEIYVPDGAIGICDYAFQDCIKLKSIRLPDNVKIGRDTFRYCKLLGDENGMFIHNGILCGYYGEKGEVEIPEGVREICPNTFAVDYDTNAGNANIYKVTLPESLEVIGDSAFEDSDLLAEISLPENVRYIGDRAFYNCDHLKSIFIPENLEYLGSEAFAGCEGLKDKDGFITIGGMLFGYVGNDDVITIPDNVKIIGGSAFSESEVKEIHIPAGVELAPACFYRSECLCSVKIDEGITVIPEDAFGHCECLESVELPDSVTRIESSAFCYCKKLSRIKLPKALAYLGKQAFIGCYNFKSIALPDGITELPFQVFSVCHGLKKIRLPKSLISIGPEAFSFCEVLEEIDLPASVEYIGDEAFFKCRSLKKVISKNDDVMIGEKAFDHCSSLSDDNGLLIIGNKLVGYQRVDKNVTVPDGVTEIAKEAFNTYSGDIKTISLPDSLKKIGRMAFCSQDILKEINIPKALDTIGEKAFWGCKKLSKIKLDKANESFAIRDGVLYSADCSVLVLYPGGKTAKEFSIPEDVKEVAAYAFADARNLRKLSIPSSVKKIGERSLPRDTWDDDSHIEEICMPANIDDVVIGEKAFAFPFGDSPIVCPKLPIDAVAQHDKQARLALGFCLDPSKYEEEYAVKYREYAKSHEKTIVSKGGKTYADALKKYFGNVEGSIAKDTEKGVVNYKKLSPKGKVEILEKAVLENNIEKAAEALRECKDIEFTSRALGFACAYAGLEMVKLLVENRATFKFVFTTTFATKYGAGINTIYSTYVADYEMLLFGHIRSRVTDGYGLYTDQYHLGRFPKIDQKVIPQNERADIAEYLISKQDETGFKPEKILFYAWLWNEKIIAGHLMDNGIRLNDFYKNKITASDKSYERSEAFSLLRQCKPDECIELLKSFAEMTGEGEKIIVQAGVFDMGDSAFNEPEVLRYLFDNTNTSKLNKSHLVEIAIYDNNVGAMQVLADNGALKTKAQRDKAMNLATSEKKKEMIAWLMDYSNKNVDMAKEAAKEEQKLIKELTEAPDSVSALKKIWSYKSNEDKTLIITSYKGTDTDVVIPEKIGKSRVTIIGENAFSASILLSRVQNRDTREALRSVVIPEGVTEIRDGAFSSCNKLEKLEIPSTIRKIGSWAIRSSMIKEIKLPDTDIEFGEAALVGNKKEIPEGTCFMVGTRMFNFIPKDKGNKKELTIPDGVTEILGRIKLSAIEKLILPEGLKVIGKGVFSDYNDLKALKLPASMRKVDDRAFHYARIKELDLNEGLEEIGNEAFVGGNFTTLKIPSSVKKIGVRAFDFCSNLKDIYLPGTDIRFVDEEWQKVFGSDISGVYVHVPAGSPAEEYIKQYDGIRIINDYEG